MTLRKLIATLTLLTFTINTIDAQYVFQEEIGNADFEFGLDMILSSDGNYLIAGQSMYSTASGVRPDMVIIKMAPNGDTIFSKHLIGPGYDYAYCILENPDGSLMLFGGTGGYSTTGTGSIVIKLDSNANPLWTKTYDGTSGINTVDVKRMPDGGFAAVATTSASDNHVSYRIDSLGNTIWQKYYSSFLVSPTYRNALSIELCSDGNLITCGQLEYSSGYQNMLLTKINATTGSVIWSRAYGDSTYFQGSSVVETSDGGFLAGGHINYGDNVIFRTDSLGNLIWAKRISSPAGDEIRNIVKTIDGGFLLCGWTSSTASGFTNGDAVLIKIDSSGNPQWSNRYGGTFAEVFQRAREVSDGYIAIGTAMFPTGTSSQIMVVKTDLYGNSGCRNIPLPLTVSNFSSLSTFWSSYGSASTSTTINPTLPSATSTLAVNQICIGNVGINEMENDSPIVYPNPSSGSFTFKGLKKNSVIKIMDITGREILIQNFTTDITTINLASFASGIYIYKTEDNKNKIKVGKLIKQ